MTTLPISSDLPLPSDAATQRFAFLGKPGSGKSYAATKFAEMLYDIGAQFVALDPVGIWFGIRMDGKGKGIPVPVFGGLHGDLPLEPTAGALLADLIVDRRLSCVLDVSQFEHDTDKARFAAGFAARFFFRMKAAPAAVHVFLEECQEFVPQNPQRGEEKMLHDFTRMDKLGRNFGIGMSLITQRPQEVNKKVLNLTECLMAFQMTGAHERKAIKDWVSTVGGDEKILETLPSLAVGHAHVYSPQWLRISKVVKIGQKRTADVSSTPRVGDAKVEGKPLTPVDLAELRTTMTATIEKAKADDPVELRKEIARLKKQITVAGGQVEQQQIESAVRAAVREKDEEIRAIQQTHLHFVRKLAIEHERVTSGVSIVAEMLASGSVEAATPDRKPYVVFSDDTRHREFGGPDSDSADVRSAPSLPERANVDDRTTDGLTRPQQRILDTLAAFEAMGVRTVDRSTVAVFSDQSPRSSGFANNLGALRTKGRIEYPFAGKIGLNSAGRALARPFAIKSVDELHRAWESKLPRPQWVIVAELVKRNHMIARVALATAVGQSPASSGFANNLGALRSLGLIDYPQSGYVVATDLLFPEGLR